ncbi:hypothetical protein M8C21_024277, partial [Ambrosia artemisiifolia]
DRLSNLPDDLIHKILSFVGVKHAIQTSVLSSRWSSQSLKHLTLTGYTCKHFILTSPTWELPALTTLNLHRVAFSNDCTEKCVGLFSNCVNLKNLTLKNCRQVGLKDFIICHPGLSNLTLEDGSDNVNLVTPQLKNLVIKYWQGIHLISAPSLSSLHYKHHYYILDISADLPLLEKVDIHILNLDVDLANCHKMVPLLQRVYSVKFLTLNSEIIKFLSSSVELISNQPSPFSNLKSLKIFPVDVWEEPVDVWEEDETEPTVTMSTEVKTYFLDGSPGATLTMVSHEEIIAAMNVVSAQKLMRKLQVVLDQLKENSETDTADMEQDKSSLEGHMAIVPEQVEVENHRAHLDTNVKWRFGIRMSHIKSYWKDLNEQMENGYKNTDFLCSMLDRIEGLLRKLPTSDRTKLQTRFTGLCLEADTLMDNMMDRMKIQCDKKPKRSISFRDYEAYISCAYGFDDSRICFFLYFECFCHVISPSMMKGLNIF